ncbi:MAG TPA: hypothetical protein VIX20_07555 [Ktedonobacteraceae bacterium]
MSTTNYTSPVNKLITIGEPESVKPDTWPDYMELGPGPEYIPELIRMARDRKLRDLEEEEYEDEDPDYWAPIHAIRALGQLHAETAIVPLVNLLGELNDDEWMFEELPFIQEYVCFVCRAERNVFTNPGRILRTTTTTCSISQ